MPSNKTKRKPALSKKVVSPPTKDVNARKVMIKKFIDEFYRHYGKMMSKLSHE
jgi:hypothetical protein